MQDIQPLYKWIIDSVIAKARPAFLQEGVDEAVLDELKARWEQKLQESGVFDAAEGDLPDADGAKDGSGEAKDGDAEQPGPSQSGEAAVSTEARKRSAEEAGLPSGGQEEAKRTQAAGGPSIPQTDGAPDPATSLSADAQAGAAKAAKDDDDDNVESDDDEDEKGDDIQNLVLAQYEKVSRTKNKWKCVMKHGIVHIDGREYVFAKATGEFLF